jgi:RimJ/RimL family protein N-acetyltransferase
MIRKVMDQMRNLFGIRVVRFKRRLEEEGLILQLCRLRDLPALTSRITPEVFQEKGSAEGQAFRSLFPFLKWVMTTFRLIYLIKVDEPPGYRTIGFAGLYHVELGRSLRLSLAVFNPEDRRRGYGEKALKLLLHLLQENGAAEVVYAEILKNNVPSLRLCGKLGFEVKRLYRSGFLLEKDQSLPLPTTTGPETPARFWWWRDKGKKKGRGVT